MVCCKLFGSSIVQLLKSHKNFVLQWVYWTAPVIFD